MKANRSPVGRRDFLRKSAAGIAAGGMLPLLLGSSHRQGSGKSNPSGVIVFQGDSITDAGRSREEQAANAPHSLGRGYAGLAAARLLGEHPENDLEIYNRGISGHKVFQLADRWQEDTIDLRPDILSILIGVNDFWHTLSGDYDGTVDVYERDYRALLDRTRDALPDVQLIIGEPFAVAGGTAIDDAWDRFDAYRSAAKSVARDYDAAWVPFQQVFDEALEQAPAAYWAPDGVHPSLAGSYLMARSWLEVLEVL